ncbi:hypothetical protein H6F76_02480 [Leptolyngbya sp. FACHB-321]|uniref:hypothetical protein n=1 Tax=Leptolyngbya sp. FACHB-321 TaxID=2692807 RepID=UPI001684A9E1|nr:hypothetical protein [Leptolyngbya sp. FACHB-321]MBD2033920.1 hypothetical protein [Leptolyngbya sp. FACHB-321]
METLQTALTLLTEVVAIAGFGGIAVHAMWKQHTTWMATYCPPVGQPQPTVEPEALPDETEEIVPTLEPMESPVVQPETPDDLWEGEVGQAIVPFRPVSRHFNPQLALPPAKDEAKPAKKPATRKPRTKKVQPLAEELGLVPPANWGKVQALPATKRTTRKRKTA